MLKFSTLFRLPIASLVLLISVDWYYIAKRSVKTELILKCKYYESTFCIYSSVSVLRRFEVSRKMCIYILRVEQTCRRLSHSYFQLWIF